MNEAEFTERLNRAYGVDDDGLAECDGCGHLCQDFATEGKDKYCIGCVEKNAYEKAFERVSVARHINTIAEWSRESPTKPGLYLVRRLQAGRYSLAKSPRIVALVRCVVGPRGGRKPLREVSQKHPAFRLTSDCEFLRIGH